MSLLLIAPPFLWAEQQILAPGYQSLQFAPPVPGSYTLPSLGKAPDGDVLDVNGRPNKLHKLFGNRIILLSFIYTTCADANGCPLATSVLAKVKARANQQKDLFNTFGMISLSFDPSQDSPKTMSDYGAHFQNGNIDWQFLTTASEVALKPILKGYSQSVTRIFDRDGNTAGRLAHVLRVFLIDKKYNIRNIYSTSFLHPDTLVSDIETLMLEEATTLPATEKISVAGNSGEERRAASSTGKQSDTKIRRHSPPPTGLPALPIPSDNPLSESSISLGRKLFFDRRLSLNGTMSCAMCHIPNQGFTNNEMATAIGIEGRTVRRNAPTLLNVAYLTRLFHDGRENSLEQQVWGPLLAANEMGNPSVGHVIEKIQTLPDYAGLFEKAFNKGVDMMTLGMALASFQRTLNSAGSDFDRWFYRKKAEAIGSEARAGFALFNGKAGCVGCHTITDKHALFTDNLLHNTGVGYLASMTPLSHNKIIQGGPGQSLEITSQALAAISETPPSDLGSYEITQLPEDLWKYRTPTLRNIALTAPYMHNGSITTLEGVIEFYDQGGISNDYKDPRIRPLNLTHNEKRFLVAFLRSLTGDNVKDLASYSQIHKTRDPSPEIGKAIRND